MKPSLRSVIMFAIAACMPFHLAHADGGRLRFSRPAGPFLVTLFTAPDPLTPGPSDFSIMVQDGTTGQILSDALVTFTLRGPDNQTFKATASHGVAVNRLLQAAGIELPVAGIWSLDMDIRQGSRQTFCKTEVEIYPGSRTAPLAWTFASLPVLAVCLFVIHQRLQWKRRQRHSPSLEIRG